MNTSLPTKTLIRATLLASALSVSAIAGAQTSTPVPLNNASLEQQTLKYLNSYDPFGNQRGTYTPNSWTGLNPDGEALQDLYGTPSPDGGHYWGLQYLSGSRSNMGGIYQDVGGLTIGHTYEISFWSLANHTNDPNTTEQWQVSFGDSSQTSTMLDGSKSTTWTKDTLSFVATSTTQRLTFAALFFGATPGVTPEVLNLDGIRIADVTPVPEPTSLALLLAGGLVVGTLAQRRRPN